MKQQDTKKQKEREKAKRCTAATKRMRLARISRMIANGACQLDVTAYTAEAWGLSDSHGRAYWREALAEMKTDWAMERADFATILLAQLNMLHKKTAETRNDSVTLGCINTAAKIARLFD